VTVADALMLALGVIAVGSGALVVTSTHLVRAGLYLVISLGATAGLYLVLGAELVAWVQVLVYVGAVVVLLLFAVMLTRAPIGPSTDLDRPAGPAALIGAGVGFGLAALLADAFHWTRYNPPPTGTAERVGAQIFGAWVLPFEVLSILLLAALVGAIVLSRPDLGARPDPEAAAIPTQPPTPDPLTESAAVVARLERIAARQANAQARLRQSAAEQRAATAAAPAAAPASGGSVAAGSATADPNPVGATPGATTSPKDVLKGKAADVIFGAQARRTRLGGDTPAEPGTTRDDVIEGTATETGTAPAPAGRRPSPTGPAIEGTASANNPSGRSPARPSIEGAAPQTGSARRSARGRPSIEGTSSETGSARRPAQGRPSIEGAAPDGGSARRPARARPSIEGSAIERPTAADRSGPAIEGSAGSAQRSDPPDGQPALGDSRPRPSVTGRAGRPALSAPDDQADRDQADRDQADRDQAGRDKATRDEEGDA
jgi:NADH:ubiquinone oxidoreductase subunit 6 (subunit J)